MAQPDRPVSDVVCTALGQNGQRQQTRFPVVRVGAAQRWLKELHLQQQNSEQQANNTCVQLLLRDGACLRRKPKPKGAHILHPTQTSKPGGMRLLLSSSERDPGNEVEDTNRA